MMRNLLIATTVLLLAACSQTPDWDYDQSTNFSNFKTFAWVKDASLTKDVENYQINPIMEKRVREAVNADLTQKGLSMVSIDKADVLINYHASVDKKIDIDTFSTHYSATWNHWRNPWGTSIHADNKVREYEVGTLIIDIVDQNSNQLIWRGAKEGRLKKNQKPEKRTQVINETVINILSNFPPQATEVL